MTAASEKIAQATTGAQSVAQDTTLGGQQLTVTAPEEAVDITVVALTASGTLISLMLVVLVGLGVLAWRSGRGSEKTTRV